MARPLPSAVTGLRYFLERDAALQGVALRLFLRAVEQCLRTHCPGCGTHAPIGAIAFICRFGAALNVHLHFHCVFAPARNGGVVVHPATAIDPSAIARSTHHLVTHDPQGPWRPRSSPRRPNRLSHTAQRVQLRSTAPFPHPAAPDPRVNRRHQARCVLHADVGFPIRNHVRPSQPGLGVRLTSCFGEIICNGLRHACD